MNRKNCPGCGKTIVAKLETCPFCGTDMRSVAVIPVEPTVPPTENQPQNSEQENPAPQAQSQAQPTSPNNMNFENVRRNTMFCRNCGNVIDEKAYVCPKCGCLTGTVDNNAPANGGLIFVAILIPLAGIIMGIVNLSSGKKRSGKAYLIASLVTWGIVIFLNLLVLAITGSY